MPRDWNFLINPFDVATVGSYRTAKRIGDYTLAAVKGKIPPSVAAVKKGKKSVMLDSTDGFFQSLAEELEPFVTDFDNKYAEWLRQQGDQRGQVSRLADSLALLRSEKIKKWDNIIRSVYDENSPEYMRLLPKRRNPFQVGSQQSRIAAVEVLKMQVNADENLPEGFRNDVSLFYDKLIKESGKSSSEKSETKGASKDVEAARIAMCHALYRTLSKLMSYFHQQPSQAAPFFDLEIIRDREQTVFRHAVKPSEVFEVFTRQLNKEDKIRIINDGYADLKFYLAATKGETPGLQYYIVPERSTHTIEVTKLGPVANRRLMVVNLSEKHKGHYIVEVL